MIILTESKRIVIVYLVSASVLLSQNTTLAQDPVVFVDPKLKSSVEEALFVEDPTPTDMLYLPSLKAESKGITNLSGLEYASNLQTLSLLNNQISDLSPLSGLVNLQWLSLRKNPIGDLSPLSGLSSLKYLSLSQTGIRDLSGLSGLNTLETLDCHLNRIVDITPLIGLTHLQMLILRKNFVRDMNDHFKTRPWHQNLVFN